MTCPHFCYNNTFCFSKIKDLTGSYLVFTSTAPIFKHLAAISTSSCFTALYSTDWSLSRFHKFTPVSYEMSSSQPFISILTFHSKSYLPHWVLTWWSPLGPDFLSFVISSSCFNKHTCGLWLKCVSNVLLHRYNFGNYCNRASRDCVSGTSAKSRFSPKMIPIFCQKTFDLIKHEELNV